MAGSLRYNEEVLTSVGHGALDRAALVALLTTAGIEALVDIRRFPNSRHNPDVEMSAITAWAQEAGLAYRWDARLGGRRRLPAGADIEDDWWRVEQFAAYAAYTRSAPFGEALVVRAAIEDAVDEHRAADDRHHQRQPEQPGPDERLGRPSDPDPDRQGVLQRTWRSSDPRMQTLFADIAIEDGRLSSMLEQEDGARVVRKRPRGCGTDDAGGGIVHWRKSWFGEAGASAYPQTYADLHTVAKTLKDAGRRAAYDKLLQTRRGEGARRRREDAPPALRAG